MTKQGQNLILNMNDKGFNVVAFNRTTTKVDAFLANEAKGPIYHSFARHDLIVQGKVPMSKARIRSRSLSLSSRNPEKSSSW